MSVELTPYHSARSLFPALALIALLGAGCSEQGSQDAGEAAMNEAPAEEMAATEAMPAEPGAPAAAMEEAATETMAAAEETATETVAAGAAGGADGKAIYDASCQSCHKMGIANAPKLGDKEAWAPRIAKGNDALLTSARNGLNAMPPRGACATCSDDDLAAAIAYMVEQGS